ncbi:MAG: HIT domain-containing protein [Gammaproteobacteria bacterium]|nr:HIT domain-containing protein [Gammaproteobacteria bacterium]MDH5777429.1 HIT domain-containing protein [Gammaproteobacteria bacterium]
MFRLHPTLAQDCLELGQFRLCRLLLMLDANYPWFILVPARENISEIYQLDQTDQQLLWQESDYFSRHIMQIFKGDKLNIGALGNVVPQLHVHHIVRYKTDVAWPKPVWGAVECRPYTDKQCAQLINKIISTMPAELAFSQTSEAS